MKNSKSKKLFDKAIKIIPLASQTFSKSYISYYKWNIPLFIDRWDWCYVWDIDWNKYIDFVNWLLPVIIWYNNKEVNNAIIKQLKNWITFSLPSPLEYELSKKLVELIPCAEMVRFGKNWTDATSAAIRLARYITNREKVAVCGYHWWQDWYIWSTARKWWVPQCVQDLTFSFQYNDIQSLEKIFKDNKREIAAIIMEPMNVEYPKDNFLQKVKDLCHKNWALFILDEIITWFRFDIWWAQKLFWVTPDIATFGKSMANWMPISAIVWKKEFMSKMDEIFFSWTFWWETLSIVSALKTIELLEKNNIINKLIENWEYLKTNLKKLIEKHNLSDIISINWYSSWLIPCINDYKNLKWIQIKSYIQKELIANWILWIWTFNLNYSHNKTVLNKAIKIFDNIFSDLLDKLNSWKLLAEIIWKEITPVFQIRKT